MYQEIKNIAKIMYEKDFFCAQSGSISCRYLDDCFITNKDMFYADIDEFFTVLKLSENYKYKDANKDAKIHSLIYNHFPNAKCVAISVNADLIKASNRGFVDFDNLSYNLAPKEIAGILAEKKGKLYACSESILSDFPAIYRKFCEQNCLLVRGFGLINYARDFDTLLDNIFKINLAARVQN